MEVNEKGLVEQKKFDSKAPPRGETGEEAQRPTSKTETMKTDRGTFKDKC
ncbi:MAG: hypothetical protein HN929_02220 [Chloroflexi bacterium]|mgnify:CR=1 FL=1|jgi:hypothetical protein|nr:hypothetical protein [Chloroflexota bacterium]